MGKQAVPPRMIKIRAEFEVPENAYNGLADELKQAGLIINMGMTRPTIAQAIAYSVLMNHEVIEK